MMHKRVKKIAKWAGGVLTMGAILATVGGVSGYVAGSHNSVNKQPPVSTLQSTTGTSPSAPVAAPKSPVSLNQQMANILAQSYSRIYVPINFSTIPFTSVTRGMFYSANLTSTELEEQKSLVTYIMLYMQQNANPVVGQSQKFKTTMTPANIQKEFYLNFAAGIYETWQNMIEIPVTWGLHEACAQSITDITIFFDPYLSHQARIAHDINTAAQIANTIATTFPTISVAHSATVLPTMSAADFVPYPILPTSSSPLGASPTPYATTVAKNDDLLISFLAGVIRNYTRQNPGGVLAKLLVNTTVISYLQIHTNPADFAFSVGAGEISCYIFWGNNHWAPAHSATRILITGFAGGNGN